MRIRDVSLGTAALAAGLAGATACAHPAEPGARPLAGPRAIVVAPSEAPGDPRRAQLAVTQVARRYYAALDDLRNRMDPLPLSHLLAPDCPCRRQLGAIRAAARRGERYTDRIRVRSVIPHRDGPAVADAVVTFDVAHGGLADHAGHRLGHTVSVRGLRRELVFGLVGERWLIERVVIM